jgi:hypothetical protein
LFADNELPPNRRFSQAPILATGELRPRRAASGRVALQPKGEAVFQIIAVPFDAYRDLPTSQHRWLLTCLARYADRAGKAWPSMRQLAADARMSLASVCRYLAAMHDLGVFQRDRRPGGRYCYQLAAAYVPRWPGRVPAVKHAVSGAGTQEAKPAKQIRFAEDFPEAPWQQRIDSWRKSRFWLPQWGPRPGDPGCWAPGV